MATPRSSKLETATGRSKLKIKRKPHTGPSLARGVTLLYRRNKTGPGTWVLKCADGHGGGWTKAIASADDIEQGNGSSILSYKQAIEQALKLARRDTGSEATDDIRPLTVAEAFDQYASELKANGGDPYNATRARYHAGALLSKPVMLLTTADMVRWRDAMLRKGLKAGTVNRERNCLRAALTLAADRDHRITNTRVWQRDLKALACATVARNIILPDAAVTRLIGCCYNISRPLGLLAEVCAQTMCRPSMAARLDVADLDMSDRTAPTLWVPRSAKGNTRVRATKSQERVPVPISESLAALLKEEARGRAPSERLLRQANGRPWLAHCVANLYQDDFREAVKAAGLGPEVTFYALRHSGISRAIVRGVPTNIIANLADTSEKVIRQHYAREIGQDPRADALARKALLEIEPRAAPNVLPLRKR
jgi:integrase